MGYKSQLVDDFKLMPSDMAGAGGIKDVPINSAFLSHLTIVLSRVLT